MSIKQNKLDRLEAAIRKNHFQGTQCGSRWEQARLGLLQWVQMLFHEVIRDDLAIRAQSLSYFALFSLMPLIAGVFLLLSFFSQWGPVQNEFQVFLERVLQPIPEESRDSLLEFILKFKDEYLHRINEQSATIGVFALGILVWITGKVFMNMEDLMNAIWSARENRSWIERLQNFVFTCVMAPLVCVLALSLPQLVAHYEGDHAKVILAGILPDLMVFFCLTLIFRFLPNVRVRWKSAFTGAAFSCLLFFFASYGLKIYFRFGTGTGYGKAVVVPIVAFFIYVEWFIFMLGAEVSFLVQNQNLFTGKPMPVTTLGEAGLLLEVLKWMQERFDQGEGPLYVHEVASKFNVPASSVVSILDFMLKKGVVIRLDAATRGLGRRADSVWLLGRAIGGLDLGNFVKDYLEIPLLEQKFDVNGLLGVLEKK